ncbi:catechol 1,2-dioxygenase [Bradyrhizobium macuxiense]|uniref:Catechol 1,2-dioxygenase n=1 Tax=Bradyrhizobium macuxiense TaxID=1755647 RepID=A0A109JGP7_9BRAD|nr:VOC family protein [Bradyrhizobium macuxiense]KWV48523.1 catechol 1,2-dioxygenase [Bradyrhizobium macuxiense]
MPTLKATEFAFPRMEAPDLDTMEEFLTHFGMLRAERTPDALYMRGADTHHLHVTHKGGTKFIGFAYHAADEDDLKRAAKLPGASGVETLDEPGGGRRVRLTEPNGYQIELIAGVERRLPPIKIARDPANTVSEPLRRAGRLMRLTKSPTLVQRIGHGVLATPKVKETTAWFRDTLGMIRSDDVYAGDEENIIGSFSRLDRGATYVDHHVMFCVHNVRSGFNHVSYEVQDIDAVFQDHDYLKSLGKYELMWGVGRHMLGSQVFDYWADPWGRMHERWADTDRLNAANGGNLLSAEHLQSQWGERPPERFLGHVSP